MIDSSNRLRLTLVIDQLGLAGTEKQFVLLAPLFSTYKLRTTLIVLGHADQAQVNKLRSSGVEVLLLDKKLSFSRIRRFVRSAILPITISRTRPQVVHGIMSRSSIFVALYRLVPSSCPIVISRRSMVSARSDGPVFSRIRIWSVRRADLVISNSKAVAEDSIAIEGILPHKSIVIYNAVSRPSRSPQLQIGTPSNENVVLAVANLRPPKDHATFLRAIGILKHRGIACTALIVGSGPLMSQLKDIARVEEIEAHFVGSVPDPERYFDAASIFVQSSYSEGLSNSLLEAAAFGLPIVATDVGGTSEIEGFNVKLVPPRDPESLADGIEEVLLNQRSQAGVSPSRVPADNNYHPERIASQYVSAYLTLAKSNG